LAGDRKGSPLRKTILICTDESLKLLEMRLLTMLATAVLLAACVHDTDDFKLFLAERGVSLTYYIGSGGDAGDKNGNDPWKMINNLFGAETMQRVKSGYDDPWDTIGENFGHQAVHRGKSGAEEAPWKRIGELSFDETLYTGSSEEEASWNRIRELFPLEFAERGKRNDHYFFGIEKSAAVFLLFSDRMPTSFRARVAEVRGQVLKLEFMDGGAQYVINAPASWTEGTQLETGFVDATTKKDRPFLGVRFWRTVAGGDWGMRTGSLVAGLPVAWPKEHQAAGASLLVGLAVDQQSADDPWNTMNAFFAKKATDPWDTILARFNGAGKSQGEYDDSWDTIGDGVMIADGKKASFGGQPISRMVFVWFVGDRVQTDDSLEGIRENFLLEVGKPPVLFKLVEVRGDIGRFELADGRSLFGVGVPTGWESGLVLRVEAFHLDTKKLLPLLGVVVWEVDETVPPGLSIKDRGDVIVSRDISVFGSINDVKHD
jgi:hypothetical protein